MTYQERLLDLALRFADAGYYVFPLTVWFDDSNGKKKLSIPFDNVDGWKAASTRDPEVIHEWFDDPRKSMKGLAIDCGKTGIVAIDLDVSGDKDGFAEWEKLPEQQETSMKVVTRSGGLHRIYRDPSQAVRNSADEVARGIDIRGNGGLIITAPTRVFGSDGVYSLVKDTIIPVEDLPALTQPMIDLIVHRQATAKPKFDASVHGAYRITLSQGDQIMQDRLNRLREGKGMRAAIFGYAVGVAQFEGAKAASENVDIDSDSLTEFIRHQLLGAVPWEELNSEDEQWIEEGVTKGLAEPWELVRDDSEPEVPEDTHLDELLQVTPPFLPGQPRTEHAIAAPVIVDGLVGRYLYVEGMGWHEWVGDRWSSEPQIPVRHAVQKMILDGTSKADRMIRAVERNAELKDAATELATLKEIRGENTTVTLREQELQELMDRSNAWVKRWEWVRDWWKQVANGYNFTQIMRFVEADPGKVYITANQLDRDPALLNCPNGTVDLRTGKLRDHDPTDFITKSTHVPYDPEAEHDLWRRACDAFAPGTEEWLQMKVGEGSFGYPTNDDTMIFNFGNGSNGKSTLTDALLYGLGDYAVFLHDKAVLSNENDHGTEKMVFRGARWAILEELPEAQVLRPATIKKLIGTSQIRARLMRQDTVVFDASHSLMINSNHRPQVLENDRGTWRRLISVPWPFTFKFPGEPLDDENDRVADPAVKHGLKRDLDVRKAALAWIVRGAVKFTENGGTCGALPEVVSEDTKQWRMESDTFGTFFDQELVIDKGHAVNTKELLDTYNDWMEEMGKRPVSETHIAGRLSTVKGGNKLQKKRIRSDTKTTTLSIRGGASPPRQLSVWIGLRWKTATEKSLDIAE